MLTLERTIEAQAARWVRRARPARLAQLVWIAGFAASVLAAAPPGGGGTASEAYAAMGIPPARVLTGTVSPALVAPGRTKQVVAVVTYLTGSRERDDAVNVRLEVFERQASGLVSLYARDLGKEYPGGVGNGDLQLVDLDGDGINEIIASFDSFADPLIEQRRGEVILREPASFRVAWAGHLKYDATKDARGVPPERRDRYQREFNVASTLRGRGRMLVIDKKVIALAGEPLAEPRWVQETFPLRP